MPLARLTQHAEQAQWWSLVHRIEIEYLETRMQARGREVYLIQTEQPRFNKQDRRPPRINRPWKVPTMTDPTSDPLIDDLLELRDKRATALAAINADFDRQEAQVVGMLQAKGYSWEKIGRELGVSKQAAWERYGTRNSEEG